MKLGITQNPHKNIQNFMFTLRLAEPSDAVLQAEWAFSTPSNGLDPSIASYPHLTTFVVEDESGPLLYTPTHPVLAIESVAVRPGITPRQYITALLEMKAATERFAQQYQMREIHTSSDYRPMVHTLCRHGYEPIIGAALRKRIA